MAKILYQAKAEPILTTAQLPETVTESRWHQPWSEPRSPRIARGFAIAMIASGVFAPILDAPQIPEAVSIDKWLQPWSEPVRVKLGVRPGSVPHQFMTTPYLQPVTIDRWLQQLSEPVQIKPRLHPALNMFSPPRDFREITQLDKWFMPLSEPKRFKQAVLTGEQMDHWLVEAAPFPELPMNKWFQALSEPKRRTYRISTSLGTSRAPNRSELS